MEKLLFEPAAIRAKLLDRICGEYEHQIIISRKEAEQSFLNAIEVSRKQHAKSWELRATTSLACFLRDTKRRDEARAMLAEIYNWFTEGFDTADLKEAKALLDDLNK